jgi:hypothetical protein
MLKNALSVVAEVPEDLHELMQNLWNWVLTCVRRPLYY